MNKAAPAMALRALKAGACMVSCDLAAHAAVRAAPDSIPALRLNPGPSGGPSFPAAFLKNADEQTVVGLSAVLHAIHDHGLQETCFTDWAVLGAPRYLGRGALAVALQRYKVERAWGISPHLIPHRSLHSVSGTISQALVIHGPNFGVSGGYHAADEALMVGATLLSGDGIPGVWLVLTGHDPEPIPEGPAPTRPAGAANVDNVPICRALALAVVAAQPASSRLKLHICPAHLPGPDEKTNEAARCFRFESAIDELEKPAPHRSWSLHCGGWVMLTKSGAGAEN